jgi:hypothetical protein
MGQGFAVLDAVLSHYRTGNSTDGFHNGYLASVYAHALAHVPRRDGTLTELANFNNDERNVIHERAVAPRSHAIKDCSPHFRQGKLCRIEDYLRKPFDPEHLFLMIKDLNEPVRVENQAITRCELNFVHGLGWRGFCETAEYPVLRREQACATI